jgi:two-component system CheB/CheR fusion protein
MSALTALAHNMSDLYKVPCSFASDEEVAVPDYTVATHLFFIAHEAVSNALKHGKCSDIRITLGARDGNLVLSVEDDGQGMPRDRDRGRGMGLRIMGYRASIIRAALNVASEPGRGTKVTCTVPLFPHGNG